ncbi:MAG TPA: hypothetical protein VFA15_00575 [Nitrososphaera sp.]|nr:hypothetical protein [Nitrososphaera sp.]
MAIVGACLPADAQTKPAGSNDNKVVAGAKAVGRGIMWGPKKLWGGMKAVGKKVSGK